MADLTHFDEQGASRMVDVSAKAESARTATASALVRMRAETLALIQNRALAKGDVLEVARLAGIMAAKRTSEFIPLCHSLMLDGVEIHFNPFDGQTLRVEAAVRNHGRTGVEMEALTAVSVAALTVYDMCKSIDRGMRIDQVQLDVKTGGRSGTYRRDDQVATPTEDQRPAATTGKGPRGETG